MRSIVLFAFYQSYTYMNIFKELIVQINNQWSSLPKTVSFLAPLLCLITKTLVSLPKLDNNGY